jgi:hypothetical protein
LYEFFDKAHFLCILLFYCFQCLFSDCEFFLFKIVLLYYIIDMIKFFLFVIK